VKSDNRRDYYVTEVGDSGTLHNGETGTMGKVCLSYSTLLWMVFLPSLALLLV
jgi:hypothetical protein